MLRSHEVLLALLARLARMGRQVLLLAALPGAVMAADPPVAVADGPAASASAPAEEGPIEVTRRKVRASTEWLARGVDGWFGSRPWEDGGSVSDGYLSVGLLKRQDQGTDLAVRFNAKLRLPNAERWGYLFIGRADQRDTVTDKPGGLSDQQVVLRDRPDDAAYVAGLGVHLPNDVDARIGFRGGLKPYAQLRYEHRWLAPGRTAIEFRQTVFWAVDDRFGSTTALAVDYPMYPSLTLRWLSAATITQDLPHFDWSSSVGAYKAFEGERLLTLEGVFRGTEGSGVGVSDYGVQVKWLQPVHDNWLFCEVLVGRFWPRLEKINPRTQAWALGAALKLKF